MHRRERAELKRAVAASKERLQKLTDALSELRVVQICPKCAEEPLDYSMHPRGDGSWQARCHTCLEKIIDVSLMPELSDWRAVSLPAEDALILCQELLTLLERTLVKPTRGTPRE